MCFNTLIFFLLFPLFPFLFSIFLLKILPCFSILTIFSPPGEGGMTRIYIPMKWNEISYDTKIQDSGILKREWPINGILSCVYQKVKKYLQRLNPGGGQIPVAWWPRTWAPTPATWTPPADVRQRSPAPSSKAIPSPSATIRLRKNQIGSIKGTVYVSSIEFEHKL